MKQISQFVRQIIKPPTFVCVPEMQQAKHGYFLSLETFNGTLPTATTIITDCMTRVFRKILRTWIRNLSVNGTFITIQLSFHIARAALRKINEWCTLFWNPLYCSHFCKINKTGLDTWDIIKALMLHLEKKHGFVPYFE